MPNGFGYVLSCSNFYYPSIRPSIFYTLCPWQGLEGLETMPAYFWPQAEKNTIKYRKVSSISQCIHCMLQDTNEIRSNPAQRGVLYVELTCQCFPRSCLVGHDFTVPSAQQAHCNIHDGLWCCQRACTIYKIHKTWWYWGNGVGHTPCEHFSIRALKTSRCSRGNKVNGINEKTKTRGEKDKTVNKYVISLQL